MRVIEIDGDGNCLYRAISKFFEITYSEIETHSDIRYNMIVELTNFEFEYRDFVDEKFKSFTEYIKVHSKDNVWGDNLTVRAISQSYQLNINIYSNNAPVVNFSVNQSKYDSICNLLYLNNNHYNLILGSFNDYDISNYCNGFYEIPKDKDYYEYYKDYEDKEYTEYYKDYEDYEDTEYYEDEDYEDYEDKDYKDDLLDWTRKKKSASSKFVLFMKKQQQLDTLDVSIIRHQRILLGINNETATRIIYKIFCNRSLNYVLESKFINFLKEFKASERGLLKGLDDLIVENIKPNTKLNIKDISFGLMSLYKNDLVSEDIFCKFWSRKSPEYSKPFMKWLKTAEYENDSN